MIGSSDPLLSGERRSRFYIRLLSEMTLVTRRVAADDSLSDREKSDTLRWANEINHCILDACNRPDQNLAELYQDLESVAEHTRLLPMVVSSAWESAAEWATTGKDAPPR